MSGLRKGRVLFLLQILLKLMLVWTVSGVTGVRITYQWISIEWMSVRSLLSNLCFCPLLFCLLLTFIPVVPLLPGDSDWVKQCLILFWLFHGFLCHYTAISRAFLTSEWQVKAKRLLVWWLNESIVHLFQTVSSPCDYKQETSRSGSPWWSRWSPRVPGSARPPGTTADRTKTPVCLPTPGTTSEVSLWCHRCALASLWAKAMQHVFRFLSAGDGFKCQDFFKSSFGLICVNMRQQVWLCTSGCVSLLPHV